ncbi:MAG: hypothetical protein U5K36_01590 [Roseovarius sp.]|nr:hypothetical protein [Roseovarius sp.]
MTLLRPKRRDILELAAMAPAFALPAAARATLGRARPKPTRAIIVSPWARRN